MKIYVFTSHAASDGEFLGTENRVFRTRKEAIAAFNRWKEDEMEFVSRDEWVIGTDEEDYFEAYEDAYYCTNHTEGFIEEFEI